MSEEKVFYSCETCCCRNLCLNRDKGLEAEKQEDKRKTPPCFNGATCANCSRRLYCMADETSVQVSLAEKVSDLRPCFISPQNCFECPINSHCKNRDLPDAKFSLVEGVATPECFSKYHSCK